MTAPQITQILQALYAKNIKVSGKWVVASCPLSEWLHKTGKDNNPSFGVSIKENEKSVYSCFACGSGTLETLVQTVEFYSKGQGGNFALCHKLLTEEEQLIAILPPYENSQDKEQVFTEWPAYFLSSFKTAYDSPQAMAYLAFRGIEEHEVKSYQLHYDPTRKLIVFPYYNVFGKFAGARGRSVVPDAQGPNRHHNYSFQGQRNTGIWYNEEALNLPGPVVVVEGQFDVIRVAKVFKKVVGNFTALPTLSKVKKLSECPFIIQVCDLDEAGEKSGIALKKMCSILGVPYKRLFLDPANGVKDCADCHPDYLDGKIKELL